MNIVRATTPDVIELVAPHMVFTDDRVKGPFITELVYRMTKAPDTLQFMVALNEEKELRAYSICTNPGALLPFVLLAQVWSHPENPSYVADRLLSQVIIWTIAMGKDYIRGETVRNTAALMRRFGFEPYLQLIKLDLVKSGHKAMLADHPEELLYPEKEYING